MECIYINFKIEYDTIHRGTNNNSKKIDWASWLSDRRSASQSRDCQVQILLKAIWLLLSERENEIDHLQMVALPTSTSTWEAVSTKLLKQPDMIPVVNNAKIIYYSLIFKTLSLMTKEKYNIC